jgi:hypothetical protein
MHVLQTTHEFAWISNFLIIGINSPFRPNKLVLDGSLVTMLSHADLVEIYLNLQLGTPLYIQGSLNSTSSYPERKPASEPKNGPSQTAPLAIDSLHDTSLPCHSLENYNEIISINISSRSIIKFFFLLFRVRNLFWLIFGYVQINLV